MAVLRIQRLRKDVDSEEERARIEALLDAYTAFVQEQFTLFLNSVRDPAVLAEVTTAIEEGRIMDAFAVVDTYVARLGETIVSQVPNIGQAEAAALATQSGVAGSGVAISFNPAAPELVANMQRNQLNFIVQVGADQRLAISQALVQATREGAGPAETARAIRDTIGLTSYQQGMVDSYRALLENNSRQALDRVLRDRRYDRGLETAIAEDEVLPEERIDLMVDRYRERLLQLRGETIARTEAGRVAEDTRSAAVYQAADQAGIPNSRVVKQWMATRDARTRDTHDEMNGQARLLDDPFDSPSGAQLMYPHDSDAPAEEVINCRCVPAYHFFATDAEARAFLLENGQGRYDDEDWEDEEPEEAA